MAEAKKLDLEAASEGVANLASAYKDVTDKVLDPEAIGGSLLERMPSPTGWRLLILPYRGQTAASICRTKSWRNRLFLLKSAMS